MKSTKNLRLRLRLMEGALLLLLGVFTTAAVSTHQLLLDAANHPAGDLDLTSAHVVGTLDPARLPPDVNFNTVNAASQSTGIVGDGYFGNLIVAHGTFSVDSSGNADANSLVTYGLTTYGPIYLDGGEIYTNGYGNLHAPSLTLDSGLSSDQGSISSDGYGDLSLMGLSVGYGSVTVGSDGILVNGGGLNVGGVFYVDASSGAIIASGLASTNPHIYGQLYYDPSTSAVYISRGP